MLQRTASVVGHQSQVDASSKIRHFSRRSQIPSQLIECDRYPIGQQRRIIFERWHDVPVGYQTVQQTDQNEQDFSSKTNPSHKTHWPGPFSAQPLIKTPGTVNIKRSGPNKRRTPRTECIMLRIPQGRRQQLLYWFAQRRYVQKRASQQNHIKHRDVRRPQRTNQLTVS